MDDPGEHYGNRNEQITKGQKQYDSTYMRHIEKSNPETEQKGDFVLEGERDEEVLLSGCRVCFARWKEFWTWMVVMVTLQCVYIKCHWPVHSKVVNMVNFMWCALIDNNNLKKKNNLKGKHLLIGLTHDVGGHWKWPPAASFTKFTTVLTKRVRNLSSSTVAVQKPQAEALASPREVLQTTTGLAPTAFAPLQCMWPSRELKTWQPEADSPLSPNDSKGQTRIEFLLEA